METLLDYHAYVAGNVPLTDNVKALLGVDQDETDVNKQQILHYGLGQTNETGIECM